MISHQRHAALALSLTVAAAGCSGEDAGRSKGKPSAAEHFAAVKAELATFITDRHVPGLAVAVILDGELAFVDAVGVKSAATNEPMTPGTVLPTGSVAAKLLVPSVLLQLESEGKLDTQSKMTDVLPWLVLPPGSQSVTFHDGLRMRAGIGNPIRSECPEPSLKAALKPSFLAPPGDIWVYSSAGYTAGAAAIEELEKRPFTDVIHDRLLEPMGMTSSTFDAATAMQGEYGSVHRIDAEGTATAYPPNALPDCKAGVDCSLCQEFKANAGLIAGVEDLARLVEHLIAQKAPLTPTLVETLTAQHTSPGFGGGYGYGYGTFTLDVKGKRFVWALTEYAGVSANAAWVPESRFGVVLLANGFPPGGLVPALQEETVAIATRFLELAGDPPDLSTPPSSWSKYEGKYGPPGFPFEITLSPAGQLEVTNPLWPAGSAATLKQTGTWAYAGGDNFLFTDPYLKVVREVTFFGPSQGPMKYMVDQGPTFLVAPRYE